VLEAPVTTLASLLVEAQGEEDGDEFVRREVARTVQQLLHAFPFPTHFYPSWVDIDITSDIIRQ